MLIILFFLRSRNETLLLKLLSYTICQENLHSLLSTCMLELTRDLVQINKVVLSAIELHLCGFNNEFTPESNLYLL